MDNFFSWNGNTKFRLVGKINGLAEEVKRTRFNLVERAKAEKPVTILADRKRAVGDDIRHHLLAYAFMRGTSYHQLERKCRNDNKPSAQRIFDIIKLHSFYGRDCYGQAWVCARDWTLQQIQQWLGE